MKTVHHVAASLLTAGMLYTIFRSWGLTAGCVISGVLIDVDHIIDYWIVNGLRFDIKEFFLYFDEKNFNKRGKLFFILHGWEWLIILTSAAWLTDWNYWITGLLIGYGQHMIFDEYYNNARYRLRPYFWGYSLLWRWKNGFDFKTAFPGAAAPENTDDT